MSLTVSPQWRQQWFDEDGNPLAGGFIYSYVSGTSTPQATYTTAAGNVANTNPIELDSAGRTPFGVFLLAASYKFAMTDANGVPILALSQDGVASTGLVGSAVGLTQFEFGGEEEATITNTSYNSGTTFDKCHPDTAWLSIDSANLVGTYALQGMLMSDGGVITTTASLVNLTDGQPDTPIVSITSTSATGERQISSAITFAAGGATKVYAIKTKVSAGVGRAWLLSLRKLT